MNFYESVNKGFKKNYNLNRTTFRKPRLQEASTLQKVLATNHSTAADGALFLIKGQDILEDVARSYEYYENITNESGILFGYFNDEEIICYSTGYPTLEALKQAVINREYMIDLFEDDEFVNEAETGEELWDELIDAIENSYVDADSYWAMFLMDSKTDRVLVHGEMDLYVKKMVKFNEVRALKTLERVLKTELDKGYWNSFITSHANGKKVSIEDILEEMIMGEYLRAFDSSSYSDSFVAQTNGLADQYNSARELPNYNTLLNILSEYLKNHPELDRG